MQKYSWMKRKVAPQDQRAVHKAEAKRATGDEALVNRIYEEIDRINTVKRLGRETAGRRLAEGKRQFNEKAAWGGQRFADTMALKKDRFNTNLNQWYADRALRGERAKKAHIYDYAGLGLSGATAISDSLNAMKEREYSNEYRNDLKAYLNRPQSPVVDPLVLESLLNFKRKT